jgi:hypothetical protein
MTNRHRRLALSLVAGAALAAAACASTSINQVLTDPQKYAERDVQLRGDVTRSVGILGNGAFELDDGTGRIWVVSRRGLPRKGAHVHAEGRLRDFANVGGILPLPKEVGAGVVLIEQERN